MACSTAAKSSMKVIRSCSAPTSLLYLCCARLRQLLPDCIDMLDALPLPPGLRHLLLNKLGWVLSLNSSNTEETSDGSERPSQLPVPSLAGPSSSESDSEGCTSDPEACQRKRCRWTWLDPSNPTSTSTDVTDWWSNLMFPTWRWTISTSTISSSEEIGVLCRETAMKYYSLHIFIVMLSLICLHVYHILFSVHRSFGNKMKMCYSVS